MRPLYRILWNKARQNSAKVLEVISMTGFFRNIIYQIANIHDLILHLNDRFAINLSDKDLHFLIFGALGLMLLALVYPMFRWLHRKNRVLTTAWIYAFTLIVILCFAIEFGQHISGTGAMELNDVIAGVGGFLAATIALIVLRGLWLLLRRLIQTLLK